MNGWSHVEMTKVDATHFTITVPTANTSLKYKYCSGPGWEYVETKASGGDIDNRTYSSNDVVKQWKNVYNPNPTPEPESGVTYNVTVPSGTHTCYIAGEMNGWSHVEMTKVDATHFTITVPTANTYMKYKYCSGPGWEYVETEASGVDRADRTYSSADKVVRWMQVYNPNP